MNAVSTNAKSVFGRRWPHQREGNERYRGGRERGRGERLHRDAEQRAGDDRGGEGAVGAVVQARSHNAMIHAVASSGVVMLRT